MVTPESIFNALRPSLGTAALTMRTAEGLCLLDRLLFVFNEREQTSLADLVQELDSALFTGLYEFCGTQMTVQRDSGEMARIYLDMLPEVVDVALTPYFASLPDSRSSFQIVLDYFNETDSTSALIALNKHFANYQNPGDKANQRNELRRRLGDDDFAALMAP